MKFAAAKSISPWGRRRRTDRQVDTSHGRKRKNDAQRNGSITWPSSRLQPLSETRVSMASFRTASNRLPIHCRNGYLLRDLLGFHLLAACWIWMRPQSEGLAGYLVTTGFLIGKLARPSFYWLRVHYPVSKGNFPGDGPIKLDYGMLVLKETHRKPESKVSRSDELDGSGEIRKEQVYQLCKTYLRSTKHVFPGWRSLPGGCYRFRGDRRWGEKRTCAVRLRPRILQSRIRGRHDALPHFQSVQMV